MSHLLTFENYGNAGMVSGNADMVSGNANIFLMHYFENLYVTTLPIR